MAKQSNTAADITVDPATGWPSAVPEMAELERASEAAHSRYDTMSERLAAAQREVQAGVTKRDALVDRTRAGEVVPGIEVAGVEIEIRAAESSAALMIEALPSLAAEVEKADRAVMAMAEKITARSIDVLRDELKRAEAEADEAEKRMQAARERFAARRGPGFQFPGTPPDPHRHDEAMSLFAPTWFDRFSATREKERSAQAAVEAAARRENAKSFAISSF